MFLRKAKWILRKFNNKPNCIVRFKNNLSFLVSYFSSQVFQKSSSHLYSKWYLDLVNLNNQYSKFRCKAAFHSVLSLNQYWVSFLLLQVSKKQLRLSLTFLKWANTNTLTRRWRSAITWCFSITSRGKSGHPRSGNLRLKKPSSRAYLRTFRCRLKIWPWLSARMFAARQA